MWKASFYLDTKKQLTPYFVSPYFTMLKTGRLFYKSDEGILKGDHFVAKIIECYKGRVKGAGYFLLVKGLLMLKIPRGLSD